MKRHCRSLLLGIALFGTAHAALAGAGWTASGRILELQGNEFGRILLRLETSANPSGCRDNQWFYREKSGGTEQMLELLLTALRSGKPVSVHVSGLCHLKGYSEISAVSISA
jgi:hypothetical protein